MWVSDRSNDVDGISSLARHILGDLQPEAQSLLRYRWLQEWIARVARVRA